MKNRMLFVFLIAMTVFFSASCGEKMPKELKTGDVAEETLYIRADGSSQIAYVEEFGEAYYKVDELKSFMTKELLPYNKKYGEGSAVVADIDKDGDQVKTVLTFKDSRAFSEFSKKRSDKPVLFPNFSKILKEYGETEFRSAEEENIKKGKAVIDTDKHNVVVLHGPIVLMTEEKILYYSKGSLTDAHRLKLDGKEEAVVVFSR